jgi:hypothetical protein
VAQWRTLEQDAGMDAFLVFLGALSDTPSAQHDEFRVAVIELLDWLIAHPVERDQALGYFSTLDAVDPGKAERVFSDLWRLKLACDIAAKHYDDRPHDLFVLVRGIWRSQVLDQIAHTLIFTGSMLAPIEVLEKRADAFGMALHRHLGNRLQLPTPASVSEDLAGWAVTPVDLEQIAQSLLAEDAGMLEFLSNWPPWWGVIERWNRAAGDQAKVRMFEYYEGRSMARTTEQAMRHRVYAPLTHQYLAAHGITAPAAPERPPLAGSTSAGERSSSAAAEAALRRLHNEAFV